MSDYSLKKCPTCDGTKKVAGFVINEPNMERIRLAYRRSRNKGGEIIYLDELRANIYKPCPECDETGVVLDREQYED